MADEKLMGVAGVKFVLWLQANKTACNVQQVYIRTVYITYLHSNNGINKEKKSDEHTNIRQGL